jgi:hypothetical protein
MENIKAKRMLLPNDRSLKESVTEKPLRERKSRSRQSAADPREFISDNAYSLCKNKSEAVDVISSGTFHPRTYQMWTTRHSAHRRSTSKAYCRQICRRWHRRDLCDPVVGPFCLLFRLRFRTTGWPTRWWASEYPEVINKNFSYQIVLYSTYSPLVLIYRSSLSIQARKTRSIVAFSIFSKICLTASRSASRSRNSCHAKSCLM